MRWEGREVREKDGKEGMGREGREGELCSCKFSLKNTLARITKSSPTDSPKTLVSGIKIFIQKFERVHPERGR